jgi:hypothetical protein
MNISTTEERQAVKIVYRYALIAELVVMDMNQIKNPEEALFDCLWNGTQGYASFDDEQLNQLLKERKAKK